MAIQHPRYFGYEAQLYWSTALFALTDWEPTDIAINNWFNDPNTKTSDEPISVTINTRQESVDITPRPVAQRGYMVSALLPNEITVSFQVQHSRGTSSMVTQLTDSWANWRTSNPLLGFAFLDRTPTAGLQEGILGNFRVSMSKQEPLMRFQTWNVTVVPYDYIGYWKD